HLRDDDVAVGRLHERGSVDHVDAHRAVFHGEAGIPRDGADGYLAAAGAQFGRSGLVEGELAVGGLDAHVAESAAASYAAVGDIPLDAGSARQLDPQQDRVGGADHAEALGGGDGDAVADEVDRGRLGEADVAALGRV